MKPLRSIEFAPKINMARAMHFLRKDYGHTGLSGSAGQMLDSRDNATAIDALNRRAVVKKVMLHINNK
jgi:hypothetical protein